MRTVKTEKRAEKKVKTAMNIRNGFVSDHPKGQPE